MRIGIFGGSFDPIHLAHINMAQYALKGANLDKIIFVPNGNPPHKDGLSATADQRLEMLSLAILDNPYFEVSDYEIKKCGLSYTVDTMRYFRGIYPNCELFFIVGADSLDYIHKWNRADELKEENTFIAINRNFSNNYSFLENVDKCRSLGYRITVVDMPFMDISSTMVREKVKNGESILDLTPERVAGYILTHKIYHKEPY